MKKYILVLIVGLMWASMANAQFSIFRPNQGGTGIGSATAGDIGNCLKVLTATPFVYELGACGGGGTAGAISTTTPLVNTQVVFSTGVASIGNDSAFTWNSTADRLTFTYASTTGWSSSYASSTLGHFGSLFAPNLSQGFAFIGSGGLFSSIASSSVQLSWFNNDAGFITSAVTAVTGTYPVISSGGATPAISLAFGTTTSNTWAGTQTFTNLITGSISGNAGTATALASNGANCSAGSYPLGVDASGAVESCTVASTGGTSAYEIATTSTIGVSQLSYFTKTSGLTTLGSVATSSLAVGTSISSSGTLGSQVGGTASTLSLNMANTNSWTALQTFAHSSTTGQASFIHASTTNFTFGGVTGNDWTDFCVAITGSAGLCDGDDATGAGGSAYEIATTSTIAVSGLSYFTKTGGLTTLGSVATTTLTATAPIALSQPIVVLGSTPSALTCAVASGSVAGCLSTTDWSTFNGKESVLTFGLPMLRTANAINWVGLATTSQPASSNILTSNGGAGVYGTATTSAACAGTLSCTAFTVIGSSPVTLTGSASGAFPFSADTNYGVQVYSTSTPTLWFKSGLYASSTSHFVNASTTQLTVASQMYGSPAGVFKIMSPAAPTKGLTITTPYSGTGDTKIGAAELLQFSSDTNEIAFLDTGDNRYLYGSGALDGIAIGNAFSSLNPPTDGLIVEGKTGIGTSTPQYQLSSFSSTAPQLALSAGAGIAQWTMRNAGGNLYLSTTTVAGTATSTPAALTINNSGYGLFVGTTTNAAVTGLAVAGTYYHSGLTAAAGTPSSVCMNATTFEITSNAALTCTVSSRKFKQDINKLDLGLNTLMQLEAVKFEYKDNPDRLRYGFIAEQVAEIDPRFGDSYKDGQPNSIDQNAILALTVKSVQELYLKTDAAKKTATDNWQWITIVLLSICFTYQQWQIQKLKKQ